MSCHSFQIICKLKQPMLDFTEEIDKISERIFRCVFMFFNVRYTLNGLSFVKGL